MNLTAIKLDISAAFLNEAQDHIRKAMGRLYEVFHTESDIEQSEITNSDLNFLKLFSFCVTSYLNITLNQ